MDGVIDLIADRGIPSAAFLTLLQMRILGVPYGHLKYLETTDITNKVTWVQLRKDLAVAKWTDIYPDLPVPAAYIKPIILRTSTGRYIQTILAQAGVQIQDFEVVEGTSASVFRLRFFLKPI